ncbi:MAG: type IV pilus secretin PilQ [Magnetococcales bacterium]|nr:type IV pilus secretin PilQ [Magnetococcales bacterium]MBF0114017.1 type IV pilus secretin PilQ [Magnetococcales bacterium]
MPTSPHSPQRPATLLALSLLLLGNGLLLNGCLQNPPVNAAPLDAAAANADSATAHGHTITALELQELEQEIRIALYSDGPLPYQAFDLELPPRLILSFSGVRMAAGVQPRTVNLPGLTALYPMSEGEESSRLELHLRRGVQYTLRERADGLDITLHTGQSTVERHGGQAAGQQINQVRLSSQPSGTQLHLLGSSLLPEPESYRLQDPPRLILDFPGVRGPAISQEYSFASREVNAVQLAGEGNRTRLVIGLNQADTPFQLQYQEGIPFVQLGAPLRTDAPPSTTPTLQAVSFSQNGATGLITLRTNSDTPPLESHREEKRLTIRLKNTQLAAELRHPGSAGQRQEVQSFGGAVQTIDTFTQGDDTQVVITLSGARDRHEIIQQGANILVQIKAAGRESALEAPVYSGAKVTMDFKEIHIHNALRLLADLNRLNLLISDSVKGSLTMRLVEVPWDQALDLILESKGLGKVLQGNVLRVAPLAELQNLADARWQANESRQTMEPILTEMIPISFAKASEIRDLLLESESQGSNTGKGNESGNGAAANRESSRNPRLLSVHGSLAVDQRTNTLIVKDVAANQVRIRELVAKLDKPIPQVMIEARIVEIERTSSFGLGINWGVNFKGSATAPLGVSNSAANAYLVQQSAAAASSGRRALMTGSATPAFNVGNQLPSGVSSNLGIHLGSLSPLLDLDIELGALESNGKAKTISSPRVLTANNKEASISQGVRQPYQTEALSGGITYQYIDAALSLKVTPHVTANGFITLDVSAKNNAIQAAITSGAPPAVSTREVETQALVKDGQTIVLGGILQHNQSESQRGIPELKEIPFLGWLFKNRSTTNNQTELMVFITPRIVNPS